MFGLPGVPLIAFIIFIILGGLISSMLWYMIKPSPKKINEIARELSVNNYEVPEWIAKKLATYDGMYVFYTFLHYFLGISSMVCSVFAIAFAATAANAYGVGIFTDVIVMLSAFALLFSALNYLTNPIRIVNTVRICKTELKNAIVSVAYNNNIKNDDKILKIIDVCDKIDKEFNLKGYC